LLARLGKLGGSPTRVSLLRCLLSLLCSGWKRALFFSRETKRIMELRWVVSCNDGGIYRARDRSGFRVAKVDYRLRNWNCQSRPSSERVISVVSEAEWSTVDWAPSLPCAL
jgi:hypothetical protein